jgi:hypothetical protein
MKAVFVHVKIGYQVIENLFHFFLGLMSTTLPARPPNTTNAIIGAKRVHMNTSNNVTGVY